MLRQHPFMLLIEILRLIVESIAALFASALLLRVWIQWVRLGWRNPFGGFVSSLTNWIVVPLRRVIPSKGRIDWASLLAAFVVALLAVVVLSVAVSAMSRAPMFLNPLSLVGIAFVWTLRWALYLVMLVTIVWAILSWVNPHSPIAPALDELLGPLLAPFRRILPTVGGLDLSPLGLFLVIQIALLVLGEASRL